MLSRLRPQSSKCRLKSVPSAFDAQRCSIGQTTWTRQEVRNFANRRKVTHSEGICSVPALSPTLRTAQALDLLFGLQIYSGGIPCCRCFQCGLLMVLASRRGCSKTAHSTKVWLVLQLHDICHPDPTVDTVRVGLANRTLQNSSGKQPSWHAVLCRLARSTMCSTALLFGTCLTVYDIAACTAHLRIQTCLLAD